MKLFYSIILLITLLAGFSNEVSAQLYFPEDMVKVTGQLVDAASGEPLSNVQVLNFRVHGGTMTDANGKFSIQADPSDNLTFKLLGYKEKQISVKELIAGGEYPKISLTIIRFQIDEVQVDGNQLKLNLGIPKGKTNNIPIELRSDFASKPTFLTAVFNPLSFLNYKLSKTEKEKRATIAAIYSERDWQILSLVYNKDIIQRLTSLKDDALDDFMVYCNAYSGFQANATTYEVEKRVKDLFVEYKKLHPEK